VTLKRLTFRHTASPDPGFSASARIFVLEH